MLPQGGSGMIEVRGPNVFKGYWRMPEKTKAEFREDGFFISGDLGYIDPRGYVYISGRGKDLIISGGFNVYPAEVEGAIEALPGVAECAVIGVPHADFGEGVVAVVTPKPGAQPRREADDRGARQRARQVQAAQADLGGRQPAPQRHGQDPEEPAARAAQGRLRPPPSCIRSVAMHATSARRVWARRPRTPTDRQMTDDAPSASGRTESG